MVIALAGRRIDAPGASVRRFPPENVERVRQSLEGLLRNQAATVLVSSAACGADLVALQQAGALALRRRVVIPFDRERFRTGSVVDRPGDWGALYDRILDEVGARGDLVVMRDLPHGDAAYAAVNRAILDEAQAIARSARAPLGVVLVWDGTAHGAGDLTDAFGEAARQRGLRVFEVSTASLPLPARL
jgi:hypothetical protein